MKIVVTGAGGFIGGRIAEALLRKKTDEITVGGRNPAPVKGLVEAGARFEAGDLSDERYASRLVQGAQMVIHCAAAAGTWGSYSYFHSGNVVITRTLLDAARQAGVSRFINLSSPSVYSGHRDLINMKESDVDGHFSDFYGRTKWEAEQLVQAAHSPGFATVSLRPRQVFGRGDRNVLPRLIALHQKGSLVQLGNRNPQGDVTTIGNLVHAVELCMSAPNERMGEAYNIANAEPVALWTFVDALLTRLGLSTARKRLPYWPVMTLAKANEAMHRILRTKEEPSLLPMKLGILAFSKTLDTTKARTRLGYSPKHSTEEGIEEFAAWWQTTRGVPNA